MDLGSWMSWFIEMVKNKQNSKKWITRFCIKIKYFRLKFLLQFNPLIPMSDRDRISPYNINTISSDEKKEKYQLGDCKLIQSQILQTNITRTIWQTVRRITNEILGVKGLIYTSVSLSYSDLVSTILNTACDLLLSVFMLVAATVLDLFPSIIRFSISWRIT